MKKNQNNSTLAGILTSYLPNWKYSIPTHTGLPYPHP